MLRDRAREALIEHLLSAAIYTRFLDDRAGVLNADRRSKTIGKDVEDDAPAPHKIGVRLALNKLIHHDSADFTTRVASAIVIDTGEATPMPRLQLPEGRHVGARLMLALTGREGRKSWRFECDLFQLVNEWLLALDDQPASANPG